MMRGLPYALILLTVLSLFSLLKHRCHMGLRTAWGGFAAFALLVWFCSPTSLTASAFTASAIEVLTLIFCLGLIPSRPSAQNAVVKLLIVWCVYEVIASTALTAPELAERIAVLSHPLAGLHVFMAMAAKSLALAGCLVQSISGRSNRLVWAAMWAQGGAIVLGMLWAQDAWMSLWQWDPIETLSLLVWIALLFAWQSQKVLWSTLALVLLICSELMAGGSLGPGSQHSYAEPEHLTAALHLAWLVSAIWLTGTRAFRETTFIDTTCALVLCLTGIMTAFGFVFSHSSLACVCAAAIIIYSVNLMRTSSDGSSKAVAWDGGTCPPERLLPSAIHRYPLCLRRPNIITSSNLYLDQYDNLQINLCTKDRNITKRQGYIQICFAFLIVSLLCIQPSAERYSITPLVRATPCGEAMLKHIDIDTSEIVISQKKYLFSYSPTQDRNYCYASYKLYKLSGQYSESNGLSIVFTDISLHAYWFIALIILLIASQCRLNPPPKSEKDEGQALKESRISS